MAVDDVISILGVGYEVHIHSNRNLKGFGVDCDRNGKLGLYRGVPVAIRSSGETSFDFSQIETITLGPGEEVDEVAGGASCMGVYRMGEVGDRASEGHMLK